MMEVPKRKVKAYHKYRIFLRTGGFIDGTIVRHNGRLLMLRECRDGEGKELDRCVLLKRDVSVIAQVETYNLNAALYLEDGWGEILYGQS